MKYWDDWADPEDMKALWLHPEVNKEWIAAGEVPGEKVNMLRDPDGRPYVTQTELRAIAEILIHRHFRGALCPSVLCAIVELESQRYPLTYYYSSKTKDCTSGLMKMRKSTVEWLMSEKGFAAYQVDWKSSLLFRPFVSVYYGAAYLRWLSLYDSRRRSEEFMVRAFHAGAKGALSKQSMIYWNKYLNIKQSLSTTCEMPTLDSLPPPLEKDVSLGRVKKILYETSPGRKYIYWEEKTSAEDMREMWKRRELKREWTKTGERPGKVRFSLDSQMRPYLKKVELKTVAEIIVEKYFTDRGIKPAMICTIAEISSKRLLFGEGSDSGIMQIPFSTASWLYTNMGYKSYKLRSAEDVTKPFVSVYFGTAYLCWLSTYSGRTRTDQFMIQSYRGGPTNADSSDGEQFWSQYMANLPQYTCTQKNRQSGCCTIM